MNRNVLGLVVAVATLAAGAAMPPSDAVVLFDGTQKSFDANWTEVRPPRFRDGAPERRAGAGRLAAGRTDWAHPPHPPDETAFRQRTGKTSTASVSCPFPQRVDPRTA